MLFGICGVSGEARRFRPTLWSSLCSLIALAILIGLGTWQIQRLAWKEALIAEVAARAGGPAVVLPDPLADPAGLVYTRVRVAGRFLHEKELYIASRTLKGAVGFHVVTPLRLDDGRVVLVDRGWVPPEKQFPTARPEGQTAGAVELEAIVRRGGWTGLDLARPANDPEDGLYVWFDLPTMALHAGLDGALTDVYLEAAAAENPGGYPIGGRTRLDQPNNHLQYALTWYALAAVLAVIYMLYSYRRGGD